MVDEPALFVALDAIEDPEQIGMHGTRKPNAVQTVPLYRRPQCSEVSPQCSEHLRTQGKLLPHHTLLPHPPRHWGFLQPEREVPGYTLDQMKEYGALCAAEALRQNK